MTIMTPLAPELYRLAELYDWRASQAVDEDQQNGKQDEWRHLSTVLRGAAQRFDHSVMLAELRSRRGIADGDQCQKCLGFGVITYANTATWRGGIGGSRCTLDVCKYCWGSGSASRPWPSWRNREAAERLIARLDGACDPEVAWIDGVPTDVRKAIQALRALTPAKTVAHG